MHRAVILALPLLALGACSGGGGAATNADVSAAGRTLLAALPAAYRNADVDHGKQVFNLCRACHVIAAGATSSAAPNLHDAWGAKAGQRPGFAYSAVLKATGWTWDAARLDPWLTDPQKLLPGTKMTFTGLRDPDDRRDVIAYLRLAGADAAP